MGKKVKKIIPKEIAPAAPFIAAYFGGPLLGKALFNPAAGVLSSAQLATAKGLTAALASKATGGDTKSALRSGFLAAAPDVVGSQLMKADPKFLGGSKFSDVLYKTGEGIKSAGALKTIGAQTSIEGAQQLKEMNEKALRDYEAQLREQGIMDSSERRNKIYGYFAGALNTKTGDRLYSDDEINSFLDKYGYKKGGRVIKAGLREFAEDFEKRLKNSRQELRKGGNAGLVAELMRLKDDKGRPLYTFEEAISKVDEEFPEEFDSSGLMSGLEGIMSGYQTATGQSLMGPKPQPTRFGLAEGGIPMTQNARKTIKELIEAGMLEDEGEGILDLIRKNPDMIGGPIMPIRPETFDLESYKIKAKNLPMFVENFIDDFKRENGRNPTIEEIKMYAEKVTPAGFAEGGMLNTGGREMDMRGGGFIPIGSRERADDVPARLSKNEFVMTADAVRAAGGGNINKGAKRMYDLMNKLEAKA